MPRLPFLELMLAGAVFGTGTVRAQPATDSLGAQTTIIYKLTVAKTPLVIHRGFR